MPALRVVLDTNVAISALVYPSGALSWLIPAWQSPDLIPLATPGTLRELWRVLGYPQFGYTLNSRIAAMRQYARWCERVVIPDPPPPVPECRDPHDRPFLEMALLAKADALVTGDQDLLALAPVFSIPIITPRELSAHLPRAG